ncbi:MAG: TetR family transcriptional regulator C-terminal domain-containing protein [Bacteroidota bacterium]|nr:TetR family transcriptional regulator C-terminal domain-containing protein [uncultured Allomuricauda sp.]
MAKKRKIEEADIIDFYMDAVVKYGGKPSSIEDFANDYNFYPDLFYEHFESFEILDKAIFKTLMDISIVNLKEVPEYAYFNKKDKLLSLYYTFFENLTLNRDFVVLTIQDYGLGFSTLSLFNELKKRFIDFIDSLQLKTFGITDSLDSIQKKSISEGLWVQFLLTIRFWMTDDSEKCQKTDIFIEKSVNTGTELLNTKSLDNLIDLGKFLYAEKIKSKDNP